MTSSFAARRAVGRVRLALLGSAMFLPFAAHAVEAPAAQMPPPMMVNPSSFRARVRLPNPKPPRSRFSNCPIRW
jgi:hypothetical protein